jgi:hypothetical protein
VILLCGIIDVRAFSVLCCAGIPFSYAMTIQSSVLTLLKRAIRGTQSKLTVQFEVLRWRQKGSPVPPPPHVKHAFLQRQARVNRLHVFVETGTRYGDTLAAVGGSFDEMHSIELSPALFEAARERFKYNPKIRLWLGDSAEELPKVLAALQSPALFWLDGHYSGEGTARGDRDTPIVQELTHIANHKLSGSHVAVIDDARLFNGADGYPTLMDLKTYTAELGFKIMTVVDDMILLSSNPSA